jgi:hypothetical protein
MENSVQYVCMPALVIERDAEWIGHPPRTGPVLIASHLSDATSAYLAVAGHSPHSTPIYQGTVLYLIGSSSHGCPLDAVPLATHICVRRSARLPLPP